jgi:hypothetical protein
MRVESDVSALFLNTKTLKNYDKRTDIDPFAQRMDDADNRRGNVGKPQSDDGHNRQHHIAATPHGSIEE